MKPLRGKRVGSAQSARRIQPGGVVRPCRWSPGGSFPPPVPPDPFTRPPSRSPPLLLPSREGGALRRVRGTGGRGRGWGRRGTAPRPATGRRRAHFHRGGAPRPALGRLGRPGGEGGSGGPPARVVRAARGPGVLPPPECYSPPAAAARRIPGPREPDPSPRSPPSRRPPAAGVSPARGSPPPRRARRRSRGGRAAPPTARPLSHSRLSSPAGRDGGGADCPQCAPGGSRRRARGVRGPRPGQKKKKPGSERTGSAAMSATHPTRLETRTKESNTCASRGLARKPPWRNEGEGRRWRRRAAGGGGCVGWVRGGVGGGAPARPPAVPSSRPLSLPPPFARRAPPRRPEVGSRGLSSPPRAHHRPVSPAAPGRWSRSARVRTRKMVNYAWAGRSQRKLWWRSVAVLTCKSVVRPGYRGERLIEPSSSWFPPKFPSG